MNNKSKIQILRRPANDGIQITVIKPTRQDWEAIKQDAAHYTVELQTKVKDLTRRARQKIESIDPARRNRPNTMDRIVHTKPWLPVVAGLGVFTVTGVMFASRRAKQVISR